MNLQDIITAYYTRFVTRYGHRLNEDQWSALNAMRGCRTEQYTQISLSCSQCHWHGEVFQSCGHRACNQCQHHLASQWLERQQRKLIPAAYFMVTFTLPKELRNLSKAHQVSCYSALFSSAKQTLQQFFANDKKLGGELGATMVLHTHSRELNYHPHVHCIVPAGSFHKKTGEWRCKAGDYLFKQQNLASVFRALLLKTLCADGLHLPSTPKTWVVDCRKVGTGLPALKYLSRYLYRGVISNKQILHDSGTHVTYQYKNNQGIDQQKTLSGEVFIYRLLMHTLPRGFRRVRDSGFLHGNAKKTLLRIQWYLKVLIPPSAPRKKRHYPCPSCEQPTIVTGFMTAIELRKLKPT